MLIKIGNGVSRMIRKKLLIMFFFLTFIILSCCSGNLDNPIAINTTPSTTSTHPHLILTPSLISELKSRAAVPTAEWTVLKRYCDTTSGGIGPGYHGSDWAEAVASFSLCYLVTGTESYAGKAVIYMDALANDRNAVGDGAGGNTRVNDGNNGYSIRNVGVFLALGYDWMYDYIRVKYPSKLAVYQTRLNSWITLYETQDGSSPSIAGYLHDVTEHGGVSNYYMAYFLTKAFTGYALHETDADTVALGHINGALTQFNTIRATYDTKLKGGDFPEGWMYGEETISNLFLYLMGVKSASGLDLFNNAPLLNGSTVFNYPMDTLNAHIHALIPSKKGVYQGHDWKTEYHGYPSKPGLSLNTVLAVSHSFKGTEAARKAQYYINSLNSSDFQYGAVAPWQLFLLRDPNAPSDNYTQTEPLSYWGQGTGTVFMRSSWAIDAVWGSFVAGPGIAVDHQHADQGHFTLVRGNDQLVIDSGDYEYQGSHTRYHNSVLVDTKGEFSFSRAGATRPGQNVCPGCGTGVAIKSFLDQGTYLSIQADITNAYHGEYSFNTNTNPATSILRNVVYIRPGYVVLFDSVHLKKDTYQPTTTVHTLNLPTMSANTFSATAGSSKILGKTLLPNLVNYTLAAETDSWNNQDGNPNNYGTNVARRIEVTSVPTAGKLSHLFLQVLSATDTMGTLPPITLIPEANGVVGVRIDDPAKSWTILFSTNGNQVAVSNT